MLSLSFSSSSVWRMDSKFPIGPCKVSRNGYEGERFAFIESKDEIAQGSSMCLLYVFFNVVLLVGGFTYSYSLQTEKKKGANPDEFDGITLL